MSSLIAALVQHFLSLRADRIKRERDRGDRLKRELTTGPELVMASEQVISALAELEKLRVEQEFKAYHTAPIEPAATLKYMAQKLNREELH